MTATVAEVTVSASDFALYETFARFDEVRFEIERVAVQADRIRPFVWVTCDDDALDRALGADPTTDDVEVLADLDGERLYRMEWVDRIEALVYALVEEDGTVLSASGHDGQWVLRLLFDDRESLGRTYDHCAENGLDLSVLRVFDVSEGRQGRFGLTEKQQDVIELAFDRGYYAIPRGISAQDLAADVGVSHQALSERLRRAHEALVANTVMIGRTGDSIDARRP